MGYYRVECMEIFQCINPSLTLDIVEDVDWVQPPSRSFPSDSSDLFRCLGSCHRDTRNMRFGRKGHAGKWGKPGDAKQSGSRSSWGLRGA